MTEKIKIVASIATIPPRIFNGDLKKCIDSLLSQTYTLDVIYVAMPKKYKRFDELPDSSLPTWLTTEEPYISKVKLLRPEEDCGSISKYLCFAEYFNSSSFGYDPYIFVGDDDQVYKSTLIEKMIDAIPYTEYNGVIQNRYEIVRFGSGGIIHGFVGLLIRASCLKNLPSFPKNPYSFFIDDQVMSIYCTYYNIPIIPSKIENYIDIYDELMNGHEKGQHAPEALHMIGNRDSFVAQLQNFYGIQYQYGGKINILQNCLKICKIMSNFFNQKCYIINLDRCPDRYTFALNNITAAGFSCIERFKGVDAKTDDFEKEWARHGNPKFNKDDYTMTGHQGCMLSHLSLWKMMVEQNIESAIVFEDDVRFHSQWKDIVYNYIEHTPSNFDILYLGSQLDVQTTSPITIAPVYCTHAYMITLEGAKKLYSLILNQPSGVHTIDVMLIKIMYSYLHNPKSIPPFIWYVWNGSMISDSSKEDNYLVKKRNTGLVFQDDQFESEAGKKYNLNDEYRRQYIN